MIKTIAILKTGSTHKKLQTIFGDFEDWFCSEIQFAHFTTFDLPNGDCPPSADEYDGFIVTGSPAMVTEQAPWSESLKPLLITLVKMDKPLLAVCYGHQLLAEAAGGTSGWHPKGREIGTVEVKLTERGEQDPLLGILPPTFLAQATHAQSVLTLPPQATLLAYNDYEPNHGFRLGKQIWSIQFHPEFSADIMRGYLFETAEKLMADAIPVKQILTQIQHAHAGKNLIQRFIDLIPSWGGLLILG